MNFVAHSMGGLIVRAYMDFFKVDNVVNCVFIATPHGGSPLAKIASLIPFYSDIFKPIKEFKTPMNADLRHPANINANNQTMVSFSGDLVNEVLEQAPCPRGKGFKLGVIAGSKNKSVLGTLFLTETSDGRVEVDAVRCSDADDFIVLPFSHKEIHHEEETLRLVKNFLLSGGFEERPNNNRC